MDFFKKSVKTTISAKEVAEAFFRNPELWGSFSGFPDDSRRTSIRIFPEFENFIRNSFRVIMEKKIEKLLRDEKFFKENEQYVNAFKNFVEKKTKTLAGMFAELVKNIQPGDVEPYADKTETEEKIDKGLF